MVPSHATAVQPRLKSWTGRIALGVDASHLSFLPSVPSPSPVIAPPMSHPFPSLLFFPSPLKFGEEVWGSTVSFPQWPAKKTAASCKSWTEPNAFGFHDLESWKGRVLRVP